MKRQSKYLFIISILIFSVFFKSLNTSIYETKSSIPNSSNNYNFTILDQLPITLEDLFSLDNFTDFEEMLDRIEVGTPFWPIRPYGTFFGHGHAEGVPRMDFHPHSKHVEIRAPVDCVIETLDLDGDTIEFIDSNECVIDCGIGVDIGNDSWLVIGHLDLLKSIYDKLKASESVVVSKGELLGFTTTIYDFSGIDFSYYYKNVVIPPHYALSPALLGEVGILYNFLYERARLNGLYPRAAMINDINIHKDDEFWGNWLYKTGPFDSYLDDSFVGHHDFGLLTFLNREFTTKETYWKDQIDTSKNLTADIHGIGRDKSKSDTPGYKSIGVGHVSLIEGDNTSGILEFRCFGGNDFGPANTSSYGKFEIAINSTAIIGDELQIEFFPTLVDAQNGFTVNASTYERYYIPTLEDIEIPPETTTPNTTTQEGLLVIIPITAYTLIAVVINRKKKE